ncbi:ADP-ribosylglycohydrolase family protein [Azoarcus olearius]|uniref:ADP-ribosyl-[dinitrogen reductase] hydrolase n=1 Tax=Azoarcus sp. (strain BH72) TaxID=418699 RepID=A1K8V6_AZOSB|nr:ADP-ribosylglycohydrolase family protein [Azoarcus olearius]CAL95261.1 putative ADP-ribosyl-[dinitrogen reductase] hydrolase [Azoarcus olearius]
MRNPSAPNPARDPRDRFRACLLGGAVGDALGAPVEFQNYDRIVATYGRDGIREMAPAYGRRGAVTDDTQMALFTAEGLLRAHARDCVGQPCHRPRELAAAYQRWLHTQGVSHPLQHGILDGWLVTVPALFARRAPGNTCLTALGQMRTLDEVVATNDSKGCGGVMRVAPVGMYLAAQPASDNLDTAVARAFALGCDAAAVTHGHPAGQLAAGAFAALVLCLLRDQPFERAIDATLTRLQQLPGHEETLAALEAATNLATTEGFTHEALRVLGEGWIAEEALAIGLYCALTAPDFERGIIRAVTHDGDSDSTGLIAGHLLGAIHGPDSLPERWLTALELRQELEQVADDLSQCGQWFPTSGRGALAAALTRYPVA